MNQRHPASASGSEPYGDSLGDLGPASAPSSWVDIRSRRVNRQASLFLLPACTNAAVALNRTPLSRRFLFAHNVLFLLHVAMNIEDRASLYAEVRRVLAPGGRFATYDLVLREGDLVYPTPWARDASTSFLLTKRDTRTTLEQAGFQAVLWRDDTQTALDWFNAVMSAPPQSGPNPG